MNAENRFRIRPTELLACEADVSLTKVPVREDSICICLREYYHTPTPRYLRINMSPAEAKKLGSSLMRYANHMLGLPQDQDYRG